MATIKKLCGVCNGTGFVSDDEYELCPACDGTALLVHRHDDIPAEIERITLQDLRHVIVDIAGLDVLNDWGARNYFDE